MVKVIHSNAPPPAVKPTGGGTTKVLVKAQAPPKLTPAEEAAQKVAQLMAQLDMQSHANSNGVGSGLPIDGTSDLAALLAAEGLAAVQGSGLIAAVAAAAGEGGAPETRAAALHAVAQLAGAGGQAAEPFVLPLLPTLLAALADKSPAVRDAAAAAGVAITTHTSTQAAELLLPVLLSQGLEPSLKWQTREGGLRMLAGLAQSAPSAVGAHLPDLVPIISDLIVDPRDQVKAAAKEAGLAAFAQMGNRDIAHLVPDLLGCIATPDEVAAAVSKLSATTFVQAIEAPALAVMVPLLLKGFKEETSIKRKACVIVVNMSKLVTNARAAAKFLPRLLPVVEKIANGASDPELRDTAGAALAVLERVAAEAGQLQELHTAGAVEAQELLALLNDAVRATTEVGVDPAAAAHSAALAAAQVNAVNAALANPDPSNLVHGLDWDSWRAAVVPYLAPWLGEDSAEAAARAFMAKASEKLQGVDQGDTGWEAHPEDEGTSELCNCRFSLAYGGKILLSNATLRLLTGRRYGLCGANGAGKSTLMRAIARGQLDGFPPADQLRTVYVEHDIQGSTEDCSVLGFITGDPLITASEEVVAAELAAVGFSPEMQQKPLTSLSGGWKMKLALARAMALGAQILLLDEPTNHLDVTNVAWLQNYLNTQASITSIIVSHDSGFLDAVCTDIIHYAQRQLRRYRGNLSKFVEAVPTAKSYYELAAASLRFRFPTPGLLDGITSKEKAIVKLTSVSFTYPGAERPQIEKVSVMIRLSSRVAVLGPNGAGKSTLIKIITGENKATKGVTWRHPNLRMAYVAQHAFHHLEEHLDTTPLKYFFKRFGMGDDKEDAAKVDRKVEEEDKARMAAATWQFAPGEVPRRFKEIVSRRKKRKDFEYEVAWQGLPSIKWNKWLTRQELEDKGFGKLVNEYDQKLASAALGNDARPLTRVNVEKFLNDFGLEPEFSCHSNIRGLSGGQKVKLVLAAAMWNNPHALIMDEPTNYLDREALGALATAIAGFEGGVVLISHNNEFTSTCCDETWHVANHRVEVVSRQAQAAAAAEAQ